MMRLQKYMAMAGIASRRASEKMIEDGRVNVNGRKVTEMGIQIDPHKDVIHVDGKRIKVEEAKVYYMLNKPRGYLSTVTDDRHRKTVLSLVKSKERVYPVGRLDLNTSGILLLTNDGDLTYQLTHPSHEITKRYVVKVAPIPSEEQLNSLREGGNIGVYDIAPCEIQLRRKEEARATYEVTLHEGKNRQIRNMFSFVGCEVVTLKRIAIANLTLKGLRVGKCRALEKEELEALFKDLGM